MVDPISLSLVGAVAAGGSIPGISASTIGAYAILGGAAVGGALIIRALTPKQHTDNQLTIKQSVPARTRAYGHCLLAGAYFFFANNGGVLVSGFALCEGPIDGFEEHWFNNTISPNGNLSGNADMWPWYNQVFFSAQIGTVGQTFQQTIADEFPGWWTPAHRLRGIANTVVKCYLPSDPQKNFSKYFPSGAPSYLARVRGAKVYDPRTTQDPQDQTTWAWSECAALCILDYLTNPRGLNIPIARIDLASFSRMANLCEEQVGLSDGSAEMRYALWGTYTLDEAPKDILDRMLKTCDGEIFPKSDGTIGIRGGRWTDPTVTIDDSMIIGCEASRGIDKMAAFNELRIRYTDIASQFQLIEGDPWDDHAAQEASGEVLPQDFEVVMVPSYTQAQRLAKIFMAKGNPAWTLTLTTNLAGLQALGERIIQVNYSVLGISETFFVNGFTINADGTGCKIQLGSLSSDAYEWSIAEEGNPAPKPTPPPTGPYVPAAPAGFALSLVRTPASGGTTVAQIAVVVTTPTDQTLTLDAQYRRQGATTWTDMSATGQFAAVSDIVANGTTYEVQAALLSFGGNDGPFVSDTIVIETDVDKPDAPTGLAAAAAGGAVTLTWTNSDSANAYAARVLRSATTIDAALLVATVHGGTAAAMTDIDTPEPGTWNYWIETINHSGDASDPTGPATVTV